MIDWFVIKRDMEINVATKYRHYKQFIMYVVQFV